MDVNKLETILEPIFKRHDVALYSMKWITQSKERVLEILIYKKDGPTDLDSCVNVSYDVSDQLDQMDELDFSYMLEVSSAGVEREIQTEAQLKEALYHHVFVQVEHPINGAHTFEGKLTKITDTAIEIAYRVKHRELKVEINRDNLRFMRLAAKI
jgi:ribosome maturation factor RimP